MREPVAPQLTVEEYLPWEQRQRDRFELHHGFIVSFAGGTTNHDLIGFNVRSALKRAFGHPCWTCGSDVKVRVGQGSVYCADAGVDCSPFDGNAVVLTSPRVISEILSESTRKFDLVEKRHAYRSMPSLEAYLIVHTTLRRVELDTKMYGEWQTSHIDAGSFALGSTTMTLNEIYDGSTVPQETV